MIAALVVAALTVVHADGHVGAFMIDRTTRPQVVAALGKPDRVVPVTDEPTGRRTGSALVYGKTSYGFSRATGRLSDFGTGSRAYVTERGSRVGMSAAAASAVERRPIAVRCGGADRSILVRIDASRTLVLTIYGGRIAAIGYRGPHSVSSDHC
jgi:hypothetical protein